MIKEIITEAMQHFTWQGGEKGRKRYCDYALGKALYSLRCLNEH